MGIPAPVALVLLALIAGISIGLQLVGAATAPSLPPRPAPLSYCADDDGLFKPCTEGVREVAA